jgi:hypothetical protein
MTRLACTILALSLAGACPTRPAEIPPLAPRPQPVPLDPAPMPTEVPDVPSPDEPGTPGPSIEVPAKPVGGVHRAHEPARIAATAHGPAGAHGSQGSRPMNPAADPGPGSAPSPTGPASPS